MNKTIVIHHSADYDGLFSREVAKKFLPPDTQFIGWDFPDRPLDDSLLGEGNTVYIIDLPVDQPFGLRFKDGWICRGKEQVQPIDRWKSSNIIWIDHHKTSIDTHPTDIPGYRIEGVAACRLAWQWFCLKDKSWKEGDGATPPNPNKGFYVLPTKEDFVNREVCEPLAVRLAGEYDIWDKRDPRAELFQYGLDTEINHNQFMFQWMLDASQGQEHSYVTQILAQGNCARTCITKRDADMMKRAFLGSFEGYTFLCLNIAKCNSLTFASKDEQSTGHDALMGYYFNGSKWMVSLYHARHRKDIDLSIIAKRLGGGGHPGACGFPLNEPPVFTEVACF